MVIETSGSCARSSRSAVASQGEPGYWYSIYDLTVRSDIRLPVPATAFPGKPDADVVIHNMGPADPPAPDGPAVAWAPCPVHGADTLVYRGPGGAWIWDRTAGTYHVAPDARRVDVYPLDAVDERLLGLALVGPIAHFILHRRGLPSLHASAAVVDGGVVTFCGPQGRGKSTMAAALLRRGAILMTDDTLPLRLLDGHVYGGPSLPMMKVWPETAECVLQLPDELPDMMADSRKKLLTLDKRFALAREPARMKAIYVLDRYDPVAAGRTETVIRPLSRQEGLVALLAQTANRSYLLPAEEARFLPLYARLVAQAPVRLLTYPDGFAYQDAVYRRVLADLEQR